MAATRGRLAIQVPLGFAAGLPFMLTGSTLAAWLEHAGIGIVAVGAFALVRLPYNFKFLWAPVLDRFQLPWLGRRRGWMLLAQLGLAMALMVMGALDPASRITGIAIIAVVIATLSASQDIVIDAYRTDVLEDDERGRGAAAYVISYRIALIIAGGGALVLADYVSWRVTYWLMATIMLGGVGATLWAPNSPASQPPDDLRQAVVLPLREFFTRRGALLALAIVMIYKFGDTLAVQLIPSFLMKTGFSMTDVGLLQKGLGMGATVVGAAIGGVAIDRIGVIRGLLVFGILQAVANVGYLAIAMVGKSYTVLVIAIGVDNLCNGLGFAAFVAFLMSLCNRRFSATQYALLTSASSILGRSLSAVSGYIVTAIGWAGFWAITIAVAAPALVLIAVLRADSIQPSDADGAGSSDEPDNSSK